MATPKQIEANRLNALKSTGPKTPDGRARTSLNAVRHGLTAQTVVLTKEDPAAYVAIREALMDAYNPVGAAELMLVNQLAAAYWRTIRSRRIEKAILDQAPDEILDTFNSHFQTYFRYDSAISRDYYRALAALDRAQENRRRDERRKPNKSEAQPDPEPAAADQENGFVSHRLAAQQTRQYPEPALTLQRPIGFVSSTPAIPKTPGERYTT